MHCDAPVAVAVAATTARPGDMLLCRFCRPFGFGVVFWGQENQNPNPVTSSPRIDEFVWRLEACVVGGGWHTHPSINVFGSVILIRLSNTTETATVTAKYQTEHVHISGRFCLGGRAGGGGQCVYSPERRWAPKKKNSISSSSSGRTFTRCSSTVYVCVCDCVCSLQLPGLFASGKKNIHTHTHRRAHIFWAPEPRHPLVNWQRMCLGNTRPSQRLHCNTQFFHHAWVLLLLLGGRSLPLTCIY